MLGKLCELRIAAKPHQILFGGHQHQIGGPRPRQEIVRLCRREAVMIVKADTFGDRDAGLGQCRKKFVRIADTGKGQHFALADGGDDVAVGLEAGMEDRHAARLRRV